MQIFDTHTHLNVEEFAGKEQEELDLAKDCLLYTSSLLILVCFLSCFLLFYGILKATT